MSTIDRFLIATLAVEWVFLFCVRTLAARVSFIDALPWVPGRHSTFFNLAATILVALTVAAVCAVMTRKDGAT